MKKNNFMKALMLLVLIMAIPVSSFAHSGRTDSSGGHKDNKNKSGLGYYHYHCGGHPPHLHDGGVCPYNGGKTTKSTKKIESRTTAASSTPKPVYATKIEPVNVPVSINAGDSIELSGVVYPVDAEDKEITWSSNNNNVIKVSSNGVLKAVGVGTAVVTASTSKGTSSSFTITVNEVYAQSIAIKNKPSNIIIEEDSSLSVDFYPTNTTNKNIEWKTDNEKIISVSSDGNIKAVGVGKTIISAVHNNLTDSFEIEVLPIKGESIKICLPEMDNPQIMKKDEQISLGAEILPENTSDKTVKWSVSDESIAHIDQSGNLTALDSGIVIVTAETLDGLKAETEIKVKKEVAPYVAGIGGFTVLGAGLIYFLKKRQ